MTHIVVLGAGIGGMAAVYDLEKTPGFAQQEQRS